MSAAGPKPHHMAKYRECRNAFELKADLERAAEVFGVETARDAAVALSLDLVGRIIERHPVDTGRARASWNIAEGRIDPSVHPEVSKGEAVPPKTYSAAALGLTGKSVIYVSNSLPYIVPLEFGHSKQAPAGMVRTAIADVITGLF